MEIAYRSFDGQYFPTAEECQAHEAKFSLPAYVTILNERVEPTHEPYEAMFIINHKQLSVEDFGKVCRFLRFAEVPDDIDAADGYSYPEGVYYWDIANDHYSHFNFGELEIFKYIYEKYSNPVDGERS